MPILLLLFALATEPRGVLCIGGHCAPAVEMAVQVEAMDAPRPFVWTSADGNRAVAGTIAAGQSRVELPEDEPRNGATPRGGRLVYPRLPPGRYELWPVLSREDLMKIYSPLAPPPAADVTLVAGTQTAVMTFTRP